MDLSLKKVIQILTNRSLFWKVGFIIGICVVVNFVLTFYFYSVTQDLLAKAGIQTNKSFYFERTLYLLVILVLLFLIWGAIAFWFMVKRPLEKIRNILDILIYDPGCIQKDTLLQFTIKDEIGDLAGKVNTLLKNFSNLETFRHLIENDETVEDVYERLGENLKSLSFSSFVIY